MGSTTGLADPSLEVILDNSSDYKRMLGAENYVELKLILKAGCAKFLKIHAESIGQPLSVELNGRNAFVGKKQLFKVPLKVLPATAS